MNFILENPVLATYLFLKFETINDLINFIILLTAILAIFSPLIYMIITDNTTDVLKQPIIKKIYKVIGIVFLVSVTISTVLPTQKQLAVIMGVAVGVEAGKVVIDKLNTDPIALKAKEALNTYINNSLDDLLAEQLKNKKK